MGELVRAHAHGRRRSPSPVHAPHVGVFLPEHKVKEAARSYSDCTVTISLENDEAVMIGAKVSTTVKEIQELLGSWMSMSPSDITIARKTVHGPKTMKLSDQVPSHLVAFGIRSFKRAIKQYEWPLLVVGAGLAGLQCMIEMRDRGRKDFQCMDKNEDFGGHSWIKVPNKFTKLQTERGTYHIDYVHKPYEPIPKYLDGQIPFKTWPSRNTLLTMMREGAKAHGLYDCTLFNVEIERVTPKKGAYAVQYVPLADAEGDAELTMVSCVSAWPGFLHEANTVEYAGEEDFDGYMEYSSFDKLDYALCTEKRVVLIGHGAFTIENVRTLVEHRCKKVTVLCRTRNLSGTKVASWLVGYMDRPVPATVLLDAFRRMYELVGFDVWHAHATITDEKRSYAQIQQATIFGVTDIYFLAGYYGLMDCVVDEVKRVSSNMVHTKKYTKIRCDVIIKAIGTRPSWKVDRQLGIKEVVGSWVNGDPLRWVNLGFKGVQAKNFGSFSVGPGLAPGVKQANWFVDYPEDWALVADKLPRNRAGKYPAYVVTAEYGMPMGVALGANVPALGRETGEAGAIKARKHQESHPPEEFLREVKAEWEAYIRFFKEHRMVDDRPDPPYPYSLKMMHELIDKANRVHNGEKPDFFTELQP